MARPIDASPGLWVTFRERAGRLGAVGPRLRALTLVAVSQLVVAAVLIALRGVRFGSTPLVTGWSGTTSVPLIVLWVTVASMTIAWAYLLAGAVRGHLIVGVLALGAFGAGLIPLAQDVGWHGAPAVVRVVALASIAALAVATWARRGVRDPVKAVVVFAFLVAVVYATFAWDASADTTFRFFSFGVADELMSVSFFLIPLLFLTGAEFANWAEVIGDRVAYVAARAGGVRVLWLLAAAISVAVLVHVLVADAAKIPSQVLLFAAGALLVVWRVRSAQAAAGRAYEIPWLAMALVACAFIGILLIEVYRTTPGRVSRPAAAGLTLRPYQHDARPGFLIDIPASWRVQARQSLISFAGSNDSFYVDSVPAHEGPDEGPLLPGLLSRLYPRVPEHLGVGREDLGWRRTTVTLGSNMRGVAWERLIGSSDWLLLGLARGSAPPTDQTLFGSMWRSFAASGQAASPLGGVQQLAHKRLDPYRYDPVLVVPVLAWLGITAVVGLALGRVRRLVSKPVALGAAFVFAFGVLFLLSDLRQVLEEIFDGRPGPVYSLRLPGIQAAVAVGTLGLLFFRRDLGRERLTNLVVLGAGLQLLVWLSHLYENAVLVGSRLSVVQAVVIVLALLWELLVSSEAVMSGDSAAFPRAMRVLALCGYVMLVATAVMFFSSLREEGTGVLLEPQFESEGWPALGIVQLGVPALLFVVALRLRVLSPRGLPRDRPLAAPAPATSPTAPPLSVQPADSGLAGPPDRP
jgi:hypothetical protein